MLQIKENKMVEIGFLIIRMKKKRIRLFSFVTSENVQGKRHGAKHDDDNDEEEQVVTLNLVAAPQMRKVSLQS